ncbi:unnamed protein product [Coffea canephora]|uniref:Uncharacterized protein n=1 Tax=Coffea canephora TaxID=49390 RepID=A0A068TY05_COFCA|nr:unnamed protein product [Coffea canephora]
MVEIFDNLLMISLCRQRRGVSSSLLTSFCFGFGSCKEGWYYRCLGVDP